MARPDLLGRTVKFHFSTHPPLTGKVVHVPAATGDCYYVEQAQDDWGGGGEYAIQQFDWMFIYPESKDTQSTGNTTDD